MYDPVQLRSFLAVAQALSFTRAADRLDLRQSTVSQHVRRLEAAVGRPLFARDTHSVALTVDGEAMVTFARDILAAGDRARRHFAAAPVRGRVRLGVSDDLVATHLPPVLRDLRHRHPLVELAVTVDLSGTLHDRFDARDLDMVFAKRPPGESRGEPLWRDRLVWLAAPGHRLAPDEPVPLVTYPPPSISRGQALGTLAAAGRAWQITCTSTSLGGLVAAAQAGIGVLAHSAALIPPGLVPAPAGHRLPPLGEVEFILLHREAAPSDLLAALTDAILAAGTRPD
ncbi:LysR substrate-binding domain-containing protein [Phytohabitans sp. ZYX-F-186]|uniref:LysR substrate-binding domain-containing protein n=1 Tax=Phytohabitans maris TaxID=3071409 RepID=A0ABU0ZNA7_9ACTN|nr:LysR substrate-binding domain-containing protein [Phytohabitans sp. ZYX-F-186]MDQ7908485.1 LysR substrate-binding domain-containing protein [Phytohabitans sp. ZYX-F-186]